MWYFYWVLLRQAPKAFVSARERVDAILFLFLAFLALANQHIERALALRWEGVSPWWAMLPILIMLGYMMAKANYEAFEEIGGIPDSSKTRNRFHVFFHERAIPAYRAARELLLRLYGLEHLYAQDAGRDSFIDFAIVQPADVAFERISDALESATNPVQSVGGEFLVAYRRMVQSINAALNDGVVRAAGITHEDPQVANWQALHDAFRQDVKSLLNQPAFSTMRTIVRGE